MGWISSCLLELVIRNTYLNNYSEKLFFVIKIVLAFFSSQNSFFVKQIILIFSLIRDSLLSSIINLKNLKNLKKN